MHRLARYCMAVVDEVVKVVEADESREKVLDALEYVKKLASKGFTPAMECLAIVHANEHHWLYDAAKAENYWKQAVELDDIEAMFDLAMFYYRGRKDRAADVISGHYWMKRCADAGHPLAIKFLQLKYL